MATTETTLIKAADEFGPILSGRFAAAELRARIEALLAEDVDVEIDFEGVDVASPSFADELFAKLPKEAIANRRVRFLNLSHELAIIARYVSEARHSS